MSEQEPGGEIELPGRPVDASLDDLFTPMSEEEEAEWNRQWDQPDPNELKEAVCDLGIAVALLAHGAAHEIGTDLAGQIVQKCERAMALGHTET